MSILLKLSTIDNKYADAIVYTVLPWMPQTSASSSVRVGVFKGLARINEKQTWDVLMKLMPKVTTSSINGVQPCYMNVNPIRPVTKKEYFDVSKEYILLACSLIQYRKDRIIDIIDVIDDVDDELRVTIIESIKMNMKGLTDSDLEKVWNKEQDFIFRHRKYSTSKWSLNEDQLKYIEDSFCDCFSENKDFEIVRLFRVDQYKIMNDHSDDSVEKLKNSQITAVKSKLASEGMEGIVGIIHRIGNLFLYGNILAYCISEYDVLEVMHNNKELVDTDFARGLFANTNPISLIDYMKYMDEIEKTVFLSTKPINDNILTYIFKLSDAEQQRYLRNIAVWQVDFLSIENFEKLVKGMFCIGRKNDCIELINAKMSSNEECVNAEFIGDFLLNYIDEELMEMVDTYSLQTILKWHQNNADDSEMLLDIEWKFLDLFVGEQDLKPMSIFKRLSESPEFFIDIIKIACGKEKNTLDSEEDRSKTVYQCFTVLNNWNTIPGVDECGVFHYDSFYSWYEKVKELSLANKVERLAFDYIGNLIFYAPAGKDFFIDRSLAELLENEEIEFIRTAYEISALNSRGTYNVKNKLESELAIEKKYLEMSILADSEGYIRLADVLRSVARSYHT